ncbi:hypothetical protein LCGC14_1126340 [marine sediment metagenome]|uniref:Uncharacterized protein n=1 Tax=marine sediment metagenome TaxID=412755 RepID=A0A0F9PKH2_9ZZZZ
MNPERRMRQLEEQQERRIHHRQVNEDIEGSVWMVGLLLLGTGLTLLVAIVYVLWRLVG